MRDRCSLLSHGYEKISIRRQCDVFEVSRSILSGKWKFPILGTLIEENTLGFMDLLREMDGIRTKKLSKELQDFEMNHLVIRTLMNTKPISVQYSITEYGETLSPLIDELAKCGIVYKESIYDSNPV